MTIFAVNLLPNCCAPISMINIHPWYSSFLVLVSVCEVLSLSNAHHALMRMILCKALDCLEAFDEEHAVEVHPNCDSVWWG